MRTIRIIAAVAAACVLGSCGKKDPLASVLEDRAKAEWQSVAATKALLDHGALPGSWDAALFVGAEPLGQLTKRFETLEAHFDAKQGRLSNTSFKVTQFDLKPAIGALEGVITVVGEAPDLKLSLSVKVDVIARYQGIVADNDGDSRVAKFKWVPMEIAPSVKWGPLKGKAGKYSGELLAGVAQYFAKPDSLVFSVPVQQSLEAETGFAMPIRTRMPIKATNGWIDFDESMPLQKVDPGSANTTAIFSDYGIWIVSALSATDVLPAAGNPPDEDRAHLEDGIATMRQAIKPVLDAAKPASDVGAKLFVAKTAFDKLLAAINAIPAESKAITIQAVAHEGRLAQKDLHDKVLGTIGAYVELASDTETKGTLSVGALGGGWTKDGLHLSAPIAAYAATSLHFHVIAPIGGGVGTTIGFKGDASQTIGLMAKPVLVKDQMFSAAAIAATIGCAQIPIVVKTDGVLKVDFGWMSVPSVGVKMYLPPLSNSAPPTSLLDSSPHLVRFLPPDSPGVHFDHPKPFGEVVLKPTSLKMSDLGMELDAALSFGELPQLATPDGEKAAASQVKKEGELVARILNPLLQAARGEVKCPEPDNPELLIGDIAIGPNNEIVKFLANSINDIANGPGDNNDIVKAGAYVGSVLKTLNPTDPLVKGFLDSSKASAKTAFGENSVAYSVAAHVDQEISNFQTNPTKYLMDMPKDAFKGVQNFGDDIKNMAAKPNIAAQFGGGKGTVSLGNNEVTISPTSAHAKVFGVKLF